MTLIELADAYAERYNQSYESKCAQEDAGYKVPTIGEARAALVVAIEAKDAEIEYWKEQARTLKADRYEHAEAMAEIESLRVDAMRYLWLRDESYSPTWINYGAVFPRHGLDSHIDDAMKAKND